MTPASFDTLRPFASELQDTELLDNNLRVLCPHSPVHAVLAPFAGRWNEGLRGRFQMLRDAAGTRRSHYFHGRFENIYPDRAAIPEVEPLVDWATSQAREICGAPVLRCGFWFNEMAQGQRTGVHTHDDADEILSAVYYVTVPSGSGALLLHTRMGSIRIMPRPGLAVFFPPGVPHEVEIHTARDVRLSLAMNFGAGA
jgi:uncharacterized RmlC-like cupin family protein